MLTVHDPIDPPATTGGHYFTLEELRAEQDIPEAAYPDSAVEPNQDLAEQVIEHACGAAFIPRRRTEQTTVGANGLIHLYMPLGREVEDITDSYGTVWVTDDLTDATIVNGYVHGLKWLPGEQLAVTYTHGYEAPPARIRRAAMIATRVWTIRGPVDDRATQIASDGATVNLATPGLFSSVTGIPEVDAAISQHQWDMGVG